MPKSTPWAGWSPTLSTNSANTPNTAGALIDGSSSIEKKVSQLMRRTQFRYFRRLMRVLNGVVAGSTAVENRARVKAAQALNDLTVLGGAVTIETVPLVGTTTAGRATTAADQSNINAMIDEVNAPTYVNDAAGNGAGANRGY